MGEFNSSQFEGESLDHLGLVAATIDYLGKLAIVHPVLKLKFCLHTRLLSQNKFLIKTGHEPLKIQQCLRL